MKVSVVIPVYNVANYLHACLESVGAQTFRDFEVIAVDDGSTDGSGRILDAWRGDFPMRVVHQANGGLSAARNAALAVATGDYVLMVDSDDCIHPRLLELTVGAAERGRLDFVLFDYRRVPEAEVKGVCAGWARDDSSAEPRELPVPPLDWFLGERRWPVAWQMLYRRATLAGRRFVPGILYEDVPFVLPYLAGNVRGAYLAQELYCYAVANGSITNRRDYAPRMAGYEAGLRILRAELDGAQYRRFVRLDFTAWLRGLWRDVRRLRADEGRASQVAALNGFLARLLDGGFLAWRDLNPLWRVRFGLAVWSARRARR